MPLQIANGNATAYANFCAQRCTRGPNKKEIVAATGHARAKACPQRAKKSGTKPRFKNVTQQDIKPDKVKDIAKVKARRCFIMTPERCAVDYPDTL